MIKFVIATVLAMVGTCMTEELFIRYARYDGKSAYLWAAILFASMTVALVWLAVKSLSSGTAHR